MKKHIIEVHEDNIPCPICNATFTKQDALNRHTAIAHHGIKPFKCELCDSSFSMKPHLNAHIKNVHEPKTEFDKPKCPDCGATFARKANLRKHFITVHEGKDS